MKFTNIYNHGIKNWPIEINIGDGQPTENDGYFFQSLSAIYDEIEDKLDLEDDWAQIIVWALFQAFHSESKILIKDNKKTLNTRMVKQSEIEWRLLENIKGEGWETLLLEYENDLQQT